MHDRHLIVEKRLERFLFERIRPARSGQTVPLTVSAWMPEGEPLPVEAAYAALRDGLFLPFSIGAPYGIPWSTTWFHCTGTVPLDWSACTVEAIIDLGFGLNPGFQAEGLLWRANGPWRALNPLNHAIRLLDEAVGGERFEFLVEAAANPQIGERRYAPSPMGSLATAPAEPQYVLKRAELAVCNREVAELVHDFDVLGRLIQELPLDAPRRPQITRAVERALDALDLHNVAATAAAGRAKLAEVLAKPAVPSAHRISAIGHAHIDTAWLWPLRETVRKCARTFANVLELMNSEPELRFVCSQAQQHDWMREQYPSVFADMKRRVGEGRFIPVGGMWVESDMNVPSGESLARQMLHGQRFFQEHYGVTCAEIWIPDVFGYPASLPQIFRLGGAQWFLTQKLSWNKHNKMPHHTMWWEGIDGTRIFTHFPPIDTYNVSMQANELAHAERNFADHGGATMSMAPFGFGDGGGGPTRDMMARYRRMRDLEGLPRVVIESPAEFFEAAEADFPDAPTWSGELYFETHRGTYTSQAKTKLGNRRAEELLVEVELWSTLATIHTGAEHPYEQLAAIWREVLTLQFHDIIPGSSIAWVYEDSEAAYARLLPALAELRTTALQALQRSLGGGSLVANPAPHPSACVVGADPDFIERIPPMSLASARPASAAGLVTMASDHGSIVLANAFLRVTFDTDGLISSMIDLIRNREVIKAGQRANVFELATDHPVEYDAWDLDAYYANSTQELTSVDLVEVVESGPLVGSVRVIRRFGGSRIEQLIVLRADSARLDFVTDVAWHEDEKVLKVAMPVDVHAREATCDIQFGHVGRPTHTSTNWDAAKFEICAHRWVDVSEPGFGVALLNDCKYGYDVQRGALRLTLLKSSNFPDPNADRGQHRFTYSLLPHPGDLGQVRAEAARLNQPVTIVHGGGEPAGALTGVISSNQNVVVTAMKMAEDASGDVIVRCYEANGGRTTTELTTGFTFESIVVCNLLETTLADEADIATRLESDRVGVALRPFQIVTLRLGGVHA